MITPFKITSSLSILPPHCSNQMLALLYVLCKPHFYFARAIMNCLAITVQFELHIYDISEGGSHCLIIIGSKIELCKTVSTTWFTKLDSKKKRTYGILGVIVHEA